MGLTDAEPDGKTTAILQQAEWEQQELAKPIPTPGIAEEIHAQRFEESVQQLTSWYRRCVRQKMEAGKGRFFVKLTDAAEQQAVSRVMGEVQSAGWYAQLVSTLFPGTEMILEWSREPFQEESATVEPEKLIPWWQFWRKS